MLLQGVHADLERIVGRSLPHAVLQFPVTFTQQSETGESIVELELATKGEVQGGWRIRPLIQPVVSM